MPIEIKELQIKAVVQEDVSPTSISGAAVISTSQVNLIIAECVEQILKILKEKEER